MRSVEEILGGEAITRLKLPIERAQGLPTCAYTGQEFYDLEQARLFPRTWMSVAFAHEVPEPGDAIPLAATGMPIMLLRDKRGVIRAFHNVCRHRASLVLTEPAKGLSTLQCPYHARTYGLDGGLLSAPYFDGTKSAQNTGLDFTKNGLIPVRCETWHGLVFVNLSGDARSIAEYMQPLDEMWAHIELDALKIGATASREFAANWKMVFDNWENYHEPFLDAGTIPLRMERGVATKAFDDIAEGCYGGFRSQTEAWKDQHAQSLALLPGQPPEAPELFIMSIFPNTTMTMTSNHIIATVWTPLAVGRTEMKVAWFFEADGATAEVHEPARQKVVKEWLSVRGQDISIWEYQQIARASPVADDVKFSPFWEAIVHRFQNKVVEALA